MQITDERTFKRLGDLEAFEFVKIEFDGNGVFGIVVDEADSNRSVIVLPDDADHASLRWIHNSEPCISFGKDWLLVPLEGARAYPGRHDTMRQCGILALNEHGWWINCATSGVGHFGRFTMAWINLDTGQKKDSLGDAAFYRAWQIWANQVERASPHGRPLLEGIAKEPPMPQSR